MVSVNILNIFLTWRVRSKRAIHAPLQLVSQGVYYLDVDVSQSCGAYHIRCKCIRLDTWYWYDYVVIPRDIRARHGARQYHTTLHNACCTAGCCTHYMTSKINKRNRHIKHQCIGGSLMGNDFMPDHLAASHHVVISEGAAPVSLLKGS